MRLVRLFPQPRLRPCPAAELRGLLRRLRRDAAFRRAYGVRVCDVPASARTARIGGESWSRRSGRELYVWMDRGRVVDFRSAPSTQAAPVIRRPHRTKPA